MSESAIDYILADGILFLIIKYVEYVDDKSEKYELKLRVLKINDTKDFKNCENILDETLCSYDVKDITMHTSYQLYL